MAYDYRKRGEAAYDESDARIGVRKRRSGPKSGKSLTGNPIRWMYSGSVPGLWMYARLTFVLGLISLVAGVALGVIVAVGSFGMLGMLGEERIGALAVLTSLVSGFTFSVPSALLLVGSGILAYLASRNDREAEGSRMDAPDPPADIPGGAGSEVPPDSP